MDWAAGDRRFFRSAEGTGWTGADTPCSTTGVKGAGDLSIVGHISGEWAGDLLT